MPFEDTVFFSYWQFIFSNDENVTGTCPDAEEEESKQEESNPIKSLFPERKKPYKKDTAKQKNFTPKDHSNKCTVSLKKDR